MRFGLGLILLLLTFSTGFNSALAVDSYQVNSGASTNITEFSFCRKVTNNHASGKALFVPTKTSPEWASFYNATVPGVSISSCVAFGDAIPNTSPVCANTTPWSMLDVGSSRVVVGGVFSRVGRCTGAGLAFSASTAAQSIAYASLNQINGTVEEVISDGAGGWYVGGTFTTVGSTTRNNLARINSDGTINAWNPNANGTVQSMLLNGTTLYVGGTFTTVGGQSRAGLAAISTSTGNASSWNPVTSGLTTVYDMALSGTTLYIGGPFTAAVFANGATRARVAGVDTASDAATDFSPWLNNNVNAVAVSGTDVYVGGVFTAVMPNIYGQGIPISTSTGTPALSRSAILNINGTVSTSISDGAGGWYVGGTFTKVGATTRNNIAHINANGSLDTSFNPNASAGVFALWLNGSTLYAGGVFTTIGGQARTRIAALNTSDGTATTWNPGISNGQVNAMWLTGTTLYIGGTFTSTVGGSTRTRIAALDTTSNTVGTWNPGIANGGVNAMWLSGTTLYVGGSFTTTVGGQTRTRLAALDTATNNATTWAPGVANGTVFSMWLSGTTLYIGGSFTSTVGGATRTRLAAISTTTDTSNVTTWAPGVGGGQVSAMVLSGTTLYIGGTFAGTTVGGQTRNYLAAISTSTDTNNATSWNPVADGLVSTLSFDGTSTVYAGGDLTRIGTYARDGFALLDATANADGVGSMTGGMNTNANINSMLLSGTTLYMGGSFTTAGGQSRNRIAALDTTTGNATSWNPNLTASGSQTVKSMALSGTTLYVGGNFPDTSTIGGAARNGVAALDTTTATNNATSWNPGLGEVNVYAIATDGTNVVVGGDNNFTNVYLRGGLFAVDTTSGNLTTFNPAPTVGLSYIYSLAISGTTLYVGGLFGTMGGSSRSNIAALDGTLDTGNATAWNPGASAVVNDLVLSGTTLYAGGQFTTLGGASRRFIGALDTTVNTSNATTWNPSTLGGTYVNDLLLDGTTMYAGGDFTTIGGAARNYLGALDTTVATSNATAWNPAITGSWVNALAISGTTLYVGGSFSNIGGAARNSLAALDTTTTSNMATAWTPAANSEVKGLWLSGTTLYAGGSFTGIGGATRNYIAALDTTTNTNMATSWNPSGDLQTWRLMTAGSYVYAGGNFDSIGGKARMSFTALDPTTGVPAW